MIYRIIRIYSKYNEIVLDPFCGTGSAIVAAMQLKRKEIGFDTNVEFANIAKERTANYSLKYRFINDTCQSIKKYISDNTVDLCITSPPYWDILNCNRSVDVRKTTLMSTIDHKKKYNGELKRINGIKYNELYFISQEV